MPSRPPPPVPLGGASLQTSPIRTTGSGLRPSSPSAAAPPTGLGPKSTKSRNMAKRMAQSKGSISSPKTSAASKQLSRTHPQPSNKRTATALSQSNSYETTVLRGGSDPGRPADRAARAKARAAAQLAASLPSTHGKQPVRERKTRTSTYQSPSSAPVAHTTQWGRRTLTAEALPQHKFSRSIKGPSDREQHAAPRSGSVVQPVLFVPASQAEQNIKAKLSASLNRSRSGDGGEFGSEALQAADDPEELEAARADLEASKRRLEEAEDEHKALEAELAAAQAAVRATEEQATALKKQLQEAAVF